jgi:hypothetical protein
MLQWGTDGGVRTTSEAAEVAEVVTFANCSLEEVLLAVCNCSLNE